MKEHIIEFTKSFDNDFEDDNILYEVGKFLNNQSTNVEIKDLANRCIELASKKGNVNAEELIRIAREKDQNSLWDFYLNSKTKDKIEESWTKRIMIEADDMSGLAKNLFDFSNTCLKIYKLRREYILPSDYYNIAAQDFGELKKDDSLYYEKMFVLALINPYFNDGLSQLKEIGSYRPAQILIEAGSENDCYKAIMGGHNYELGFQESNRKGLKKFVTNLYGFRNYGKSN